MTSINFADLYDAAEGAEGGFAEDVHAQPGKYVASVVFAKAGKSKDGTKENISIKFKVDTPGPEQGHVSWATQTLSTDKPAALGMWFKAFAALGLAREFWAGFGADLAGACAVAADTIVGRQASITVEENTYNGNTSLRVKYINELPGSAGAPAAAKPAAAPAAPSAQRPAF